MRGLAVVTGTSRGFGRACTEELVAADWTVVALVRTAEDADGWRGRRGVEAVVHDVRSHDLRVLLDAVGGRPVDALVNNAAQGAPRAGLEDLDADSVVAAAEVNVAAPLRLVQGLLPSLLAAPAPVVVNVSSRLGSMTAQARGDYAHLSTSYAYRISKAAQNMLTVALAHELQGRVRCWAVHPGALATTMGQADAATSPADAARQLRELLASTDPTSPRFCSLGAADLDW